MRIYLDDDMADPLLLRRLRTNGHDVILPADLGLSGSDDAVHLARSIVEDRVLLTGNHEHFEQLHHLIGVARGSHTGILVVRRDNDPSRDMKQRDVARAVTNLVASGIPIANELHVLNHWR